MFMYAVLSHLVNFMLFRLYTRDRHRQSPSLHHTSRLENTEMEDFDLDDFGFTLQRFLSADTDDRGFDDDDSTISQAIDTPEATDTPDARNTTEATKNPQATNTAEAADGESTSGDTESPHVHSDNATVTDGVTDEEERYVYPQLKPEGGAHRWWLCARHGCVVELPNRTCYWDSSGQSDRTGMRRCSFPDEAISSKSYWCCRVCTANTNLIPAGALGRPDFPLNAPTDLKCKKCASLRHDYPGLDNNYFEHMVYRKNSCYHVNLVDAVTCGNPKCDAKLRNHPLGTRVVFVGRIKCLATFLSKKRK